MNHVTKEWNIARGRKPSFKGKDVFFMLLTVLHNGETWAFSSQMFKIKAPTFEKLITNFLKVVSSHLYEGLVMSAAERCTMPRMMKDGSLFSNFKYHRYESDVTLQQSNSPSGNMQEGKIYFSEMHKLYGLKTEVSVLSNGIDIGCTAHYLGPSSDIDICIRNITFHKDSCAKRLA